MADWVFVSPHLDDVALSCGGAVAKAARAGSPLIVTVFAGEPTGEMSDFAHFQHERWHLPDTDAVELRRCEDRRATEALGESVRSRWLDFPDAIYRDPRYSSDEALFGPPLDSDAGLIEDVHQKLRELGATRYVVPLGVGNHVDHQIVRAAGALLLRGGAEVWSYAEVPYALDEEALLPALLNADRSEPVVIYLDDDAMQRKAQAVSCYESQLPVLFRDRGDPDVELKAFALNQGDGDLAERLWRWRPADDPLLRRRPFVA